MLVSELQAVLDRCRLALSNDKVLAPSNAEVDPQPTGAGNGTLRPAEGSQARDLAAHAFRTLLVQTYGQDPDAFDGQVARLGRLCALFSEQYGDGPVRILRAPARINIIGEHVDYVSYLPTASLTFGCREHDMVMLYRPLDLAEIHGTSTLPECPSFRFGLSEGPQALSPEFSEERWVSYVFSRPVPEPHWSNYAKGSVFFALMRFGQRLRRGFCFVVDSTIRSGGGASSSSALTVLAGAAVRRVNQVGFTDRELAHDSSRAEWYLGTRGGAMDHTTICLARHENAVHLSYAKNRFDRVALPAHSWRWVSFYSHAADKSREIMLEYNERAAVSRLIIPALLKDLLGSAGLDESLWPELRQALEEGNPAGLQEVRQTLDRLPETVVLADLEQSHPETHQSCREAFPALIKHRSQTPLRVRDLALHHLGEISRVNSAVTLFGQLETLTKERTTEAVSAILCALGNLLDQSHASLRDLYRISTPVVERLRASIKADPHVYGARLMGGGFGGNVLALVPAERVPHLLQRVQSEFYGPRALEGVKQGMVMVSTPGDGLSGIDPESAYRHTLELFNARWSESDRDRQAICQWLDNLQADEPAAPIWPVIVAAGKGERARKSGLEVPKPLAEVEGVPSILHVLRTVRQGCPEASKPIIVVSPETEQPVRQLLAGESVTYTTQPQALGTGDAVYWASERLRAASGWTLVVWSTQPVIHPATVRRTLKLAALFPEYDMIFPTALIDQPYAPLRRDAAGRVAGSQETHLEKAAPVARGETNIGLFLMKFQVAVQELEALRRQYWNSYQSCYNRPGGELGFPNEMVTLLAQRACGVFCSPIADWRETQGIKSLEDLIRCEQFLSELKNVDS
ncbi:MAG: hypothetical protein FJW26_20280 [Acidimicrobiia bacterium]|nr:hypothetical protein [Acidimicrobiia bacterium]